MYLRKRISKGKEYWSINETFRDNEGKVKQKLIRNLGNAEKALEELKLDSSYSQFYFQLLSYINSQSNVLTNATCKVIQGNSLLLSKLLEDIKVNTCVTSPPYYAQRDYGVPGTYWPPVSYIPMAGLQEIHIPEWTGCLGLEPTPEMYVGHMVLIFREVWKVLREDGTLWLNLGDTYCSTAPGTLGDKHFIQEFSNGAAEARRKYRPKTPKGLKPKDLMGIPWRVAFALQADGWYFRIDNVWNKPNPTPESVKDRTTRAHEYIFLLSKSQRYYYNSDAILEPYTTKPPKKLRDKHAEGYQADYPRGERFSPGERDYYSRGGKNKRSVWTIPVKKPKSTNYATFPPDIARTCILAGCPEDGIVLDVFGGTGTTAEVAKDLQRSCICVELKEESAKIAYERVCGE
ncbi:MAG TPA: site-specific DNA-methyltransferase [Sedimentibacter sp.]|nr:site-specific DNA-methyltransferase [Sedimentibacter sp.]